MRGALARIPASCPDLCRGRARAKPSLTQIRSLLTGRELKPRAPLLGCDDRAYIDVRAVDSASHSGLLAGLLIERRQERLVVVFRT